MIRKLRPVLRWHGGKWMLAPWIISRFPEHRVYTEAFGGAASVLLQKPRSYSEVYNDLDCQVVNLFRVLQDLGAEKRLKDLLLVTPFAREEFSLAYEPSEDPVEGARRLIIRSFMGFGSNAHNPKITTGFRANSNRSGTIPAKDWMNYPRYLDLFTERFRGVVVENREAVDVILQHDTPKTLHYVDPPYPHSSRSDGRGDYSFEMTDEQHRSLSEVLHRTKGMVIISGYRCDLYEELYDGWHSVERRALADGARERVEVLWANAAAVKHQNELFTK